MCEKGEGGGGGEHRWFPTVQTSYKKYIIMSFVDIKCLCHMLSYFRVFYCVAVPINIL